MHEGKTIVCVRRGATRIEMGVFSAVNVVDLPVTICSPVLWMHIDYEGGVQKYAAYTHPLEAFLGACKLQPAKTSWRRGTEFSPVASLWKVLQIMFDALMS